jgi:spore germination protein YaaH
VELTYAPVNSEMPSAMSRALEFGKQRDAVSGSPYYTYEDSTGWYQGWFEDVESLSRKTDFIREMRLGGAAAFPLGYGNAELVATMPQPIPPAKRAAPLPVFRMAGD